MSDFLQQEYYIAESRHLLLKLSMNPQFEDRLSWLKELYGLLDHTNAETIYIQLKRAELQATREQARVQSLALVLVVGGCLLIIPIFWWLFQFEHLIWLNRN